MLINSAFNKSFSTGVVLSDIAAHLPPDYLSGAICIAGAPKLGSAIEDVVTPATANVLPKLASETITAAESEAALTEFTGLCFSHIDEVPWDVKWRWRGMMGSAPPSSYGYAMSRETDPTAVIALAKKGFPLHVIVGTDDQMIRAENLIAEVSKFFTKVTSRIVEKGSHAVFHQNTQEVVDSITSYVHSNRWMA